MPHQIGKLRTQQITWPQCTRNKWHKNEKRQTVRSNENNEKKRRKLKMEIEWKCFSFFFSSSQNRFCNYMYNCTHILIKCQDCNFYFSVFVLFNIPIEYAGTLWWKIVECDCIYVQSGGNGWPTMFAVGTKRKCFILCAYTAFVNVAGKSSCGTHSFAFLQLPKPIIIENLLAKIIILWVCRKCLSWFLFFFFFFFFSVVSFVLRHSANKTFVRKLLSEESVYSSGLWISTFFTSCVSPLTQTNWKQNKWIRNDDDDETELFPFSN